VSLFFLPEEKADERQLEISFKFIRRQASMRRADGVVSAEYIPVLIPLQMHTTLQVCNPASGKETDLPLYQCIFKTVVKHFYVRAV
jgi:hypothetical protein